MAAQTPPPAINAVMNVASYADESVSPGEMIVIFGTDLGPDQLTHLRVGADGKLVNELEGVRVFASGLPCPLIYVSKYQLSAMVPYGIAQLPSTKFQVVYGGRSSNFWSMPVSPAMPGIFTANASGKGQAAMTNSDGSYNAPNRPANPGDWVTFYLTGEGQITPSGNDGTIIRGTTALNLPVTVRVGGYVAPLLYAGSAPGNVNGFAQINAIIPPNLPFGGELPLTVEVGGIVSRQEVTVSVSGLAGPKPGAPADLTLNLLGNDAIRVRWRGTGPAATRYLVERAVDGGGFAQVAAVSPVEATFDDAGIGDGSDFRYRLQGFNEWGVSAYSAEEQISSPRPALSAPNGLKATAASSSTATLEWSNKDAGATQIAIERRLASERNYTEVARIPVANSYVASGLNPGTDYKFRVKALSSGGVSRYSNETSARTLSSGAPPPAEPTPVVQISVSPTLKEILSGQSQTFLATVTGSTNTAVTWTYSPQIGTLSSTGLYTAPAIISAAQTVTVTARSVADTTKFANAVVNLVPPPPPVQVSVSPTLKDLLGGQSQTFVATVTGSTNTAVTWTYSPQIGTLSSTGVYTAPATITGAQAVTITARSAADSTKSANATVNLVPPAAPIQVSLNPTSKDLLSGQSQTFVATVTGSANTGVTWTHSPQVGTLSGGGVYTAPAVVGSAQTITITARSVADSSRFASAVVNLIPPVPVQVSLTPTLKDVSSGQSQTFVATVSGSTNTAVTWTHSPQVGTLSSSGVYTAPATISAAEAITITARSVSDTTKFANAVVNLVPPPPPVQVSVTPASRDLSPGQSQTFVATVTGSTNTAVTWTHSPQVGTLSSSGLYTAPATVSAAQSITITARSVADTTKSANAVVNLVPPPPEVQISVTPTSRDLSGGQSQTFVATVTGSTNTGVTWTRSPEVGTLSASGVYTAPAVIASAQAIIITARSAADTTKSANAVVNLVPPPPQVQISVTPTSRDLSGGQSQTFAATVTGSTNTAVTWTHSPQVGTLSSSGVYTAPATIPSAQAITITARSAADTTKTANAVVNLVPPPPPVQVSVTPTSRDLSGGQSQTFIATVTGSTNTAVTWTHSPQVGTLSSGGVYTAPATISSAQAITITARSAADTTKTANAVVNLVPPPPPTDPNNRSFWSSGASPANAAVTSDQSPVTLGLRFTSTVSGRVTGLKFYKGSTNGGTHVGALWNNSGGNLAQVVFSGETASGWQQANFAAPVSIAANTTYVVSYFAPQGNYAEDQFYGWTNLNAAPLTIVGTAPGVYSYGTSSTFPTSVWNSSNYWVDVLFTPDTTTPPPGPTYSISGRVTGTSATLSLSGPVGSTTTTDGSGNYTFSGLGNGLYVISPSRSGYSFSPSSTSVTVSSNSVTGVNFSGTANPPAPRSVLLTWSSSPSLGVVGYHLYRATAASGPFAKLTSSPVAGTSYTDTNVTTGQTYYYLATSVDGSGLESAYSNQATAPVN